MKTDQQIIDEIEKSNQIVNKTHELIEKLRKLDSPLLDNELAIKMHQRIIVGEEERIMALMWVLS